ncbi:MAG TPA: hypothetical protein VFA33_15065 [Bryobacteraceae bacterium]|nr:hypothetical protein [Bryobacteraceae bacterium]
MSLRDFQHAVVDLTLVPHKARALRQGDASVLANFDLTARERERLLDIVHQPGMRVSCSLSRGNRLEVIAEAFPMTCVLLEPVLRQLLDELWTERRPANYQLAGEDTAFAELLARKRAANEICIEYLDEIFAYELKCREMAHRMRTETTEVAIQTVIEFQHPPDMLLVPLSQLAAPPAGLPSGFYRARIQLQHGRFEVAVLPD